MRSSEEWKSAAGARDALALLDAAGDLSAADPDTGLSGRQPCDAAIATAALGLFWLEVHGSR